MELHVLVREYDPATEKWQTLFDDTQPVPDKMDRNRALRWMLAKVLEIFQDKDGQV